MFCFKFQSNYPQVLYKIRSTRLLPDFQIPVQTLENYLTALEIGYSKHNNPYHNIVHAADVTASSHFMLSQTGLAVRFWFMILFQPSSLPLPTSTLHVHTCFNMQRDKGWFACVSGQEYRTWYQSDTNLLKHSALMANSPTHFWKEVSKAIRVQISITK